MKKFIGTFIGRTIGWGINFFILKYSIIFALYLSDIDSAQHMFWITVMSVVISFIKISITFGFNTIKEHK